MNDDEPQPTKIPIANTSPGSTPVPVNGPADTAWLESVKDYVDHRVMPWMERLKAAVEGGYYARETGADANGSLGLPEPPPDPPMPPDTSASAAHALNGMAGQARWDAIRCNFAL